MNDKGAIRIRNLGTMDYDEAWKLQHDLFDSMVKAKREHRDVENEWLLIVEHLPVVTLGRHAKESNLLFSEGELQLKGVKCRHIERGGDVTYHGPGQIVMYPLIDLERHGIGVKQYVGILEEAVIRVIDRYGIKGERIEGASGVWIGKGGVNERKICAVGVKCSRFCTMHGLALNVTTDLNSFGLINPCGFIDKGVTSIAYETCRNDLNIERVKEELCNEFLSVLPEKK